MLSTSLSFFPLFVVRCAIPVSSTVLSSACLVIHVLCSGKLATAQQQQHTFHWHFPPAISSVSLSSPASHLFFLSLSAALFVQWRPSRPRPISTQRPSPRYGRRTEGTTQHVFVFFSLPSASSSSCGNAFCSAFAIRAIHALLFLWRLLFRSNAPAGRERASKAGRPRLSFVFISLLQRLCVPPLAHR